MRARVWGATCSCIRTNFEKLVSSLPEVDLAKAFKKDFADGCFDDLVGKEAACRLLFLASRLYTRNLATLIQHENLGWSHQTSETAPLHRTSKVSYLFQNTTDIYINSDLDYVSKYFIELPLKYHTLKSQWIVQNARGADIPGVISSSAESDTRIEEKVPKSSNGETIKLTNSSEKTLVEKPRNKRSGDGPVTFGKYKGNGMQCLTTKILQTRRD